MISFLMKKLSINTQLLIVITALFCCGTALSDPPLKIAVIGKTLNDSFYETSMEGCKEFAKAHDDLECVYDGPLNYQDPRHQVKVVQKVVEEGIDGILISVTDSSFLAEHALQQVVEAGIPVITFDSDLLTKDHALRLAYVGTNNFDFGYKLGEYARKFEKEGEINRVCIQTGSTTTPNLNERMRGVRAALSDGKNETLLNGEAGWAEYRRCPFYTDGKRVKALTQLEYLLDKEKDVVFLAVAGFAQFSPDYIKTIAPWREEIQSRERIIISADAEEIQLEALRQGLSTANIGQLPFEMGRVGAELMYDYLKNKKRPEKEFVFTGYFVCEEKDGPTCIVD